MHDFVRTQEEPIISTGPYAQYAVMREASQHVTVLLDGQGADEMMAGYNPYFYVYLRQLRRQKRFKELASEIVGSRDILRKLGRLLRPHLGADRGAAELRLRRRAQR